MYSSFILPPSSRPAAWLMNSSRLGSFCRSGCLGLNWNKQSTEGVSLTSRRKVESSRRARAASRLGPLSAFIPPYSRTATLARLIFGQPLTSSLLLGEAGGVCALVCAWLASNADGATADCAAASGAAARMANAPPIKAARSRRRPSVVRSIPRICVASAGGGTLSRPCSPIGSGRLPMIHATHVHRSVGHRTGLWVIDLNLGHHPFVFMFQDVAVEHEAPDDSRVGEREADLHLAMDRHIDRVLQTVERHRRDTCFYLGNAQLRPHTDSS